MMADSRRVTRLHKTLEPREVEVALARNRRVGRSSSNPGEFIELIDGAIRLGRKIEIWYSAASDGGEEVRRRISPLAFRMSGGLVLVVAYNNHGEIRSYRLDRISRVRETWTDALDGPYSNYIDYLSDSDG